MLKIVENRRHLAQILDFSTEFHHHHMVIAVSHRGNRLAKVVTALASRLSNEYSEYSEYSATHQAERHYSSLIE